MILTDSYLNTWPGRLSLPRLCVELAKTGGEAGGVSTALLQDLAADLDDAGVLAWLLEHDELSCAAMVIAESPTIAGDPEATRDAQERLARRHEELRARLVVRAEDLRGRADAAGLKPPADFAELVADTEDLRLPELQGRLDELERTLTGEIDKAKDDANKLMAQRNRRAGVAKPLLDAWSQRVNRGQLVAAERLLAVGRSEAVLPPDAVSRLRPWDPTVNAPSALEGIAQAAYRGDWKPTPEGKALLTSYAHLRRSGSAQAADHFSADFAAFLGADRARPPIGGPGGYFFRLDLMPGVEALPLEWLADVKIVLCLTGATPPAKEASEDRLIGIDCGAGPQPASGRSHTTILSPGDLIRLSSAETHRALHLLRLLGRGWTSRALGIGNSSTLEALLSGPEAVAWGRLSWLLDVLDLGGTELARELTERVGLHPHGLHILIESLLRATGSREARRQRWAKVDMYSQLEQAVLPSQVLGPAGRVAFLALLAADGFGTPLQVPELQMSIELEGGVATDELLEEGIRDLIRHPLVESRAEPEPAVRLRRCATLSRMRRDAPRLLLEALSEVSTLSHTEAWKGHRWALLPGGIGGRTASVALVSRAKAIDAAEPATEQCDVVPILEEVIADCQAAFPALQVNPDLPAHALAAVAPEALRTILAEVLQNAVDALAEAQRDQVDIALYSDSDDITIDVIDDGDGVSFSNSHAVFRLGRTTRGEARGRGLYDAERLAGNIEAQLVVAAQTRNSTLRGAHFHIALPRKPNL